MMSPDEMIHCDWSLRPEKRFMARGTKSAAGWRLSATESVPADPISLLENTKAQTLFLGVDFPLGVPLAWAKQIGVGSFCDLLAGLADNSPKWNRFDEVAETPDQISLTRPFYPRRPGGTSQQHLLDGLNVASIDDLRRVCDRPTANRRAAAPLFWTMGAQQVGKAALAGWRSLLIPTVQNDAVGLWPFDGTLTGLMAEKRCVIAEVYPAEMGVHVGIEFPQIDGRPSGKRLQVARQHNAKRMLDLARSLGCTWSAAWEADIRNGFGDGPDGEDRFDATVGLLGMLLVASGRLAAGEPPSDAHRQVEGWILAMAGEAG